MISDDILIVIDAFYKEFRKEVEANPVIVAGRVQNMLRDDTVPWNVVVAVLADLRRAVDDGESVIESITQLASMIDNSSDPS